MKFECKPECSACCRSRGQVNFVFLNEDDLVRLEAKLGKDRHQFAKISQFDYARWENGPHRRWHLDFEKECKFLDGHKCSVYEARPTQCRTWPFHLDADLSICPGVGEGRMHDPPEVEAIFREDMESFEKGAL